MTEWKEYKLEDVVDVTMGQSPKSEFYNTERQGFPFLQGNRTFGRKYPTFDTWTTKMTKEAKAGDVIMSVRAPVGDLNITPVNMCLGRGVCGMRMKNGKQDFLYYLIKFSIPKLLNKETGTIFGSVNRNDINGLNVMIPDDETQDKIATFLKNIDDKIETNEVINRNLSEQIQLLYSEYFECEKAKNWNVVPLSDLIFYQEGPGIRNWQYVEEDGTKFINIRCINNGDIDVSTANMISNEEAEGKYAHFMLKPYDIVMSCSGTLGRYAIVREEHLPLCLNTSVIRFSPAVTPDDFSYVYGYMTSKEFLNRQQEMACGSVQANFGPTHLKKMEIHEPPQELRKEYHEVVFPIIKQMICLRRENDRLAKTRDSLLPKLMSGELDVSNLDI